MVTYLLQNPKDTNEFDHYSLNKSKRFYTIDAQGGLNGIKKEAYNKVPNGPYKVFTKTGKNFGYVTISEESKYKAERKRPRLSKEQYDQLYYYLEGRDVINLKLRLDENPLDHTAPSSKRYDSLVETRRAALSKSYKTYTTGNTMEKYYENWKRNNPIQMYIFKGARFIGIVEYSPQKGVNGLWIPAGKRTQIVMNKDGTLR